MTTEVLHPDHLKHGDMVGPWKIVEVLGLGGSSRVFKVERDGRPYSMKMALRPVSNSEEVLSQRQRVEEAGVYRRLAREVATLFIYSSHPNLLRVYAVDFWPHPGKGFPFLVTDYVDGDTWHEWRWKTPLDLDTMLDTWCELVRTVGELHRRGVFHRDLKAENVLIRREDGRVFLIDFGTARLPGAYTKTLGMPEGALHLVSPELVAYMRREGWRHEERFEGGVPVDLYALGVLLYQGLTDMHPFDPKLPDKTLVTAIATVVPTAPHLLNPRVPRSISDIVMRLLEKKPEDRYPDTDAVLRAVWNARKERTAGAWKVPLFTAEELATEPAPKEAEAQPTQPLEIVPEAPKEAPPPVEEGAQAEARREAPAAPSHPRRARWLLVLLACLAVLGLALWLVRSTLTPPPEALMPGSGRSEKGSPPVSTPPRSTPSSLLAAWLCAVAGIGCPAAQVKPPEPEDCPEEAIEAMSQVLKIDSGSRLQAVVDINQPGEMADAGVYQDGPVIGRIARGELPEGTLLHGRLWTGPGIYDNSGRPAVKGRYTLAILPDGRKYPVCIVLGNPDEGVAPVHQELGSKPGAAVLNRELPVSAVQRWP
jgi:eukaryotic-like serine/threonine-protein kinase